MLERFSLAVAYMMVFRQAGIHIVNPDSIRDWMESAAYTGDLPMLLSRELVIPFALWALGLIIMLVA